jgi:hypothetical protein
MQGTTTQMAVIVTETNTLFIFLCVWAENTFVFKILQAPLCLRIRATTSTLPYCGEIPRMSAESGIRDGVMKIAHSTRFRCCNCVAQFTYHNCCYCKVIIFKRFFVSDFKIR